MTLKIDHFLITEKDSIKDAMRLMDKNQKKIAFVVDDKNEFKGTVTDGDVRRWILAGGQVTSHVKKIYNTKPLVVDEDYDIEETKKMMIKKRIDCFPVVNNQANVVDVLVWDQIFNGTKKRRKKTLKIPVVIMAGGSGTRLAPFTDVLPKPLIPIKGKPIIEIIIDKFREYNVRDFYISVNYKSKILRAYFEELEPKYRVEYIIEKTPLGTAGCLSKLKSVMDKDVLITNCDIIIDCDYNELIAFHRDNQNDITLVGSMRHHVVPYGICMINEGGELNELIEKPSYDYLISTGMYVLSAKALKMVPKNKMFHMTDLIDKVKAANGKVGVFPISEKSWIDIGQWEEYRQTLKELGNV